MPMRKISTLQFYINISDPENKSSIIRELRDIKDDVEYKAPEHCVENIMNFARSYKVVETKTTGKVELLLN